jgi:outer membrane protein W
MRKSILAALPVLALLAAPVAADPAVGLGVNFSWGGSGSEGGTGVGLRLFSDDKGGEFVGSLGADYMISSQRIRPNLGVAYLASKGYVGMDVGFNMDSGGVDVGLGFGASSARR